MQFWILDTNAHDRLFWYIFQEESVIQDIQMSIQKIQIAGWEFLSA